MAVSRNRQKRHSTRLDHSQPIEILEKRTLLAATLSGGVLTVNGTAGADNISIAFVSNSIVVTNPAEPLTASFMATSVNTIVVTAGTGSDRVTVDDDVRKRTTINGGDGDDSLQGGGANDEIFGEAGNDLLVGGGGSDVINGGLGADTADYSTRTRDLSLTLDGVANDGSTAVGSGAAEGDDLHSSIDVILAGTGDDLISAAGLALGRTFYGNSGEDSLIGSLGADRLNGGNNDDRLDGSSGDDVLVGGEGDQIYIGGAGNDTVTYYFTNRRLRLSLDGVANDGVRTETSDIRSDVETVVGGGGADVISGNTGRNNFFGGKGDDSLFGQEGNDMLFGQLGNDSLTGNDGSDYLYGGDGADTLVGSAGSDRMFGENGNDLFRANDGKNDTLNGGLGTDAAERDLLDSLTAIP